jgi:hypothetical protein
VLVPSLIRGNAAVIPFLYGYPLHAQCDAVGKKVLLLSGCLLALFLYTAATKGCQFESSRGAKSQFSQLVGCRSCAMAVRRVEELVTLPRREPCER